MFVERRAELHSWNDWYDIHTWLELWVTNRPQFAFGSFLTQEMTPLTFSQRQTTWQVLNLTACPHVAQCFAKKQHGSTWLRRQLFSIRSAPAYFTICSPFPDLTCLMAFTGEWDYREWKHSGESQSRHRHPLSFEPQAAAEKKQPKSFCCNISPPITNKRTVTSKKKKKHSMPLYKHISSPSFQKVFPKYSKESCRGLSS